MSANTTNESPVFETIEYPRELETADWYPTETPGGEVPEVDVPPVVQLFEEFGYEPYSQGEYDYLREAAELEHLEC